MLDAVITVSEVYIYSPEPQQSGQTLAVRRRIEVTVS
jgi:hypothetical protein